MADWRWLTGRVWAAQVVQSIKDNITQEEVVDFVRAPPGAPGPAALPAPAPAQGDLAGAPAGPPQPDTAGAPQLDNAGPPQPDTADGSASFPSGSRDAASNAAASAAADNAAGRSEEPST